MNIDEKKEVEDGVKSMKKDFIEELKERQNKIDSKKVKTILKIMTEVLDEKSYNQWTIFKTRNECEAKINDELEDPILTDLPINSLTREFIRNTHAFEHLVKREVDSLQDVVLQLLDAFVSDDEQIDFEIDVKEHGELEFNEKRQELMKPVIFSDVKKQLRLLLNEYCNGDVGAKVKIKSLPYQDKVKVIFEEVTNEKF